MTVAISATTEVRAQRPRIRVTPNLFGIGFGLAGLAQVWTTAGDLQGSPTWPADLVWAGSALSWLAVTIGWLVTNRGSIRIGLADPTFSPFISLGLITPVLLGGAIHAHWPVAGAAVAISATGATVAFGGWLLGNWVTVDVEDHELHPGHVLPTVAGGLVTAAVMAQLGHHQLAVALFGVGIISWLLLGSIVRGRLFSGPRLHSVLLPSLAIEIAPPVVAGNAWFAINGGRIDTVALLLAGYAGLMILFQLHFLPAFARTPFNAGFWAFSFSYAAVVSDAIHWVSLERVGAGAAISAVLVGLSTLAMSALLARTALALAHRELLPRPTPAAVGA